MSIAFENPYEGTSFFQFILLFLTRLFYFLTNQLSFAQAAPDEIQLFVLFCISSSAALGGTFLVLRRMTMLANSLSHTILIGIIAAVFFIPYSTLVTEHGAHSLNIQAMLLAAVSMGVITALLTEFLHKVTRLQEDASTGIVFTTLFALGIMLITLFTRNLHIGTEVVMGNVDALHLEDCLLALVVLTINVLVFSLFFKEFQITTFDPQLSQALGISPFLFNYLLMILVSTTVIAAFRAVGVLMVLAFITGPMLTARLLTHDFKKMIALAIGLSCLSSFIGVALSRHLLSVHGLALSTGGVIVCIILLLFCLAVLWNSSKKRMVSPQS